MKLKLSQVIGASDSVFCDSVPVDISLCPGKEGHSFVVFWDGDDFRRIVKDEEITIIDFCHVVMRDVNGSRVTLSFAGPIIKMLAESESQVETADGCTQAAIFLYSGFDQERLKTGDQWPDLDAMNGHLGLIARITELGKLVNNFLVHDERNYPGTFHYEITEAELGSYLFKNLMVDDADFLAHLNATVDAWIGEEEERMAKVRSALKAA